jgi:DNA (cytosine-5)-methyltransferase 1
MKKAFMIYAYYNEIDPYAAQWLRNLILAGHIAPGIIDERSIEDIKPDELKEFTQCHFFAGIGGWSLALRLAGWPDDKPVWTGSCPCQPFSASGKGGGFDDERHLWPAWHWLISQCKPSVLFGEQVASGAAKDWLDLISNDLENLDYAFGAIALPACGIGAPHIRQRTWWLADAINRVAESDKQQRNRSRHSRATRRHELTDSGGSWAPADWLSCRDGKYRPVEPGTFPLAYGISNRVGRLRAYGNAIVPQLTAEVIKAFMSCKP